MKRTVRISAAVRLAGQRVALLSSSPTDSSPTRGDSHERKPRIRRQERELHQMLGSAFDRRAAIEQDRRPAAGRNDCRQRGPIHAGSRPNAACAAITAAPVCPALKSASARRLRTASAATRMDARGLRRSAAAAGSAISTHSGASSVSIVQRVAPGCRLSSASTTPRADEQQPDLQVPGRDKGSVDDAAGPMVTAHGVDGDAHQNSLASCQLPASPRFQHDARNPNARHPREGEGSILLRIKPKVRPRLGSQDRSWKLELEAET
jgi:hypothetical protein